MDIALAKARELEGLPPATDPDTDQTSAVIGRMSFGLPGWKAIQELPVAEKHLDAIAGGPCTAGDD